VLKSNGSTDFNGSWFNRHRLTQWGAIWRSDQKKIVQGIIASPKFAEASLHAIRKKIYKIWTVTDRRKIPAALSLSFFYLNPFFTSSFPFSPHLLANRDPRYNSQEIQ
jgi:hypothetical protein